MSFLSIDDNGSISAAGVTAAVEASTTLQAAASSSATAASNTTPPNPNDTIGTGTTVGPGATGYVLVAGGGAPIYVNNILVESDEDITWELWSGNSFKMIGPHTLKAGQPPTTISFPHSKGFPSGAGDSIRLVVSSNTAVMLVSYVVSFS